MTEGFGWSESIAALLGAIASGGGQAIAGAVNRRKQSKNILIAISAEVQALCALIRHQQYLEAYLHLVDQIDRGEWDGNTWVMDIRSQYFSVYEALAPSLGCLNEKHIAVIVTFYSYCKSAIDSTRTDGPFADPETRREDKEGNIRSLALTLNLILQLGDQIIQFPTNPSLPTLASMATE